MRDFLSVTVNKKAENALKAGHPWVYGEETTRVDSNIKDGDIVDVYSSKNRYLGSGFYNSQSKIAVRILSVNANDKFDEAFFERRIRYAVLSRLTVMQGNLNATRLIFGDSDMLPGFIVDKFNDVLVTQIMCLGIEQRKASLFQALQKVLGELNAPIRVIYERNDVKVRQKEGLPLYKDYYRGQELLSDKDGITPTVTIEENGILYEVDYINGQKTGFFLDQKFNRSAAASLAKGKTVLDCFTHTGAFALNCAKNGAENVTAVDISEEAIEQTKKNARINGISNMDFLCCDVFDLLTKLCNKKAHIYDYIILDPPAFTKSSSTVTAAFNGYKEINLKAMRILPRGGYLATCSCSHFMTDALFRKMLHQAAMDAGVQIRILEYRQQAPDHPVLLGVPETEYLKFYLLQIV